jgi:preprotein translocase subunit SecB
MSVKQPFSGYAITRVYSTHLEMHAQEPSEDATRHDAVGFGWDWRWIEERRAFEVRISLVVEPSAHRHQYAAANTIGQFRLVDEAPAIPIEEFARLQAVAILLPYARQFLTELTGNSLHGPYYLPSLNVHQLMEGFDPAKATAANQVTQSPKKGRKGLSVKKR